MKHDYLETSLWYREKIMDPNQVIAQFFTSGDIASYRKTIRKIVQAACSNRIYSKNNPGDLLYKFKMLESVINSAYLINQEKKKSPLLITQSDAFSAELFAGSHAKTTAWDYFPRLLSWKEFSDPYLAFRRFFKFAAISRWKDDLNCLLDYSLGKTNLFEAGIDIDIFNIYLHLIKLVEAAHLVDVREIKHVDGRIKSRVKIS